uniref:Uncharacterized protein n=1 Tax=Anguilla anguilla TaxID=7936 RepID=A0A0E9QAT8_ANGAN
MSLVLAMPLNPQVCERSHSNGPCAIFWGLMRYRSMELIYLCLRACPF